MRVIFLIYYVILFLLIAPDSLSDEFLSSFSWHLFKNNSQRPERHPFFKSAYADFIRTMWDSNPNIAHNITSIPYRELEFDRTIDYIYKHQFPQDCSNKNFLVSYNGYPSGFGSEIHMEGYFLYLALEMNRIYIPYNVHPHHTRFNKNRPEHEICHGSGSFFECFYQPLTNCSWDDVSKHLPSHSYWKSLDYKNFIDDKGSYHQDRVIITDMRHRDETHQKSVPSAFLSWLDRDRIEPQNEYYWWRAVSAAFMTVPSQRTKQLIERYRIKGVKELNGHCVAMYVRWGDKALEMKLHEFSEYVSVANELWSLSHPNTSQIQPTIIFGTETKEVMEAQLSWTHSQHKWKVLYNPLQLQIFRYVWKIENSKILNEEYDRNPHLFSSEVKRLFEGDHSWNYLIVLLNLSDFLMCDVFVCTLASNFCRVLDELRALVAGKPGALFADLSGETCVSPPCYGNNRNFSSFDW